MVRGIVLGGMVVVNGTVVSGGTVVAGKVVESRHSKGIPGDRGIFSGIVFRA